MTAALVTAVLLAAPPAADRSLAEGVVRRIEERHAGAGDLTARFVQVYRSGLLGREVTERGIVSIKRPGRMRWDYKDPEPKTFVSDGRNYFFYVPADRQVVVRSQDGERSIPSLLLSGKGDILGQFAAELQTPPGEGLLRLRLTPRKPEPEIETVTVDVEPSGRIREIQVDDGQGNRSRFRFDNIRENVGLSDKIFRFEVPPGVEVIQG
ncbi:MAG: outer membrane lipoprotein chaperone LolA [Solirubrobacterales bacterium]